MDTVSTKSPTMADSTVASAYADAKTRNAKAGTSSTILTGGLGDTSSPSTAKKTLLGS
jgi:hypothetical protein